MKRRGEIKKVANQDKKMLRRELVGQSWLQVKDATIQMGDKKELDWNDLKLLWIGDLKLLSWMG